MRSLIKLHTMDAMGIFLDTVEDNAESEGWKIESIRQKLGIPSSTPHSFPSVICPLCHFDFYSDNQKNYNLFQDINRSQFESLIQLQIQDAMGFVDKILHDARFQASQINQVLLIGGTSRIPLLINEMHKTFGLTKVIDVWETTIIKIPEITVLRIIIISGS